MTMESEIQTNFINEQIAKFEAFHRDLAKRQQEDNERFVAQAKIFWAGDYKADPSLPRFDDPNSIQFETKEDQWECDEWLQVCQLHVLACHPPHPDVNTFPRCTRFLLKPLTEQRLDTSRTASLMWALCAGAEIFMTSSRCLRGVAMYVLGQY